MGHPGYVLHPNGSRIWTEDKWAYINQHPETHAPTAAAIQALNIDVACNDMVEEAYEQGVQEDKEEYAKCVKRGWGFGHYCVGGRVARNCDECGARLRGGCGKCRGTKVVFEECEVCVKEREEAAAAAAKREGETRGKSSKEEAVAKANKQKG